MRCSAIPASSPPTPLIAANPKRVAPPASTAARRMSMLFYAVYEGSDLLWPSLESRLDCTEPEPNQETFSEYSCANSCVFQQTKDTFPHCFFPVRVVPPPSTTCWREEQEVS